jgi:hypothetical protein
MVGGNKMIELNESYVRKDTGKGEVKPFQVQNGIVKYSHVGFFDWRERTISNFLEMYKKKDNEQN